MANPAPNNPPLSLQPAFQQSYFRLERRHHLPLGHQPAEQLLNPLDESEAKNNKNNIDLDNENAPVTVAEAISKSRFLSLPIPVRVEGLTAPAPAGVVGDESDYSVLYNELLGYMAQKAREAGLVLHARCAKVTKVWFKVLNEPMFENWSRDTILWVMIGYLWMEYFPNEPFPFPNPRPAGMGNVAIMPVVLPVSWPNSVPVGGSSGFHTVGVGSQGQQQSGNASRNRDGGYLMMVKEAESHGHLILHRQAQPQAQQELQYQPCNSAPNNTCVHHPTCRHHIPPQTPQAPPANPTPKPKTYSALPLSPSSTLTTLPTLATLIRHKIFLKGSTTYDRITEITNFYISFVSDHAEEGMSEGLKELKVWEMVWGFFFPTEAFPFPYVAGGDNEGD